MAVAVLVVVVMVVVVLALCRFRWVLRDEGQKEMHPRNRLHPIHPTPARTLALEMVMVVMVLLPLPFVPMRVRVRVGVGVRVPVPLLLPMDVRVRVRVRVRLDGHLLVAVDRRDLDVRRGNVALCGCTNERRGQQRAAPPPRSHLPSWVGAWASFLTRLRTTRLVSSPHSPASSVMLPSPASSAALSAPCGVPWVGRWAAEMRRVFPFPEPSEGTHRIEAGREQHVARRAEAAVQEGDARHSSLYSYEMWRKGLSRGVCGGDGAWGEA